MDEAFMRTLTAIREHLDFPLIVTSAHRCPRHNARVSITGKTGPHTTSRAVDIAIQGNPAIELVVSAKVHGMTGFGINQKGKNRFIHLDNLTAEDGFHRPWIWSY
jgi:uncharacterized protein YcbK (DUF882 family)